MRKLVFLGIVLAGTLASGLVGCSTAESRRASLLDPELKGSLELEVQKPELNDAGQLLAQATIVNRMPDSQHVMIQTMFFDIEGNPIEPGAPWENKILPAYGTVYYRKASLAEGAVDFKIQMRRGKVH